MALPPPDTEASAALINRIPYHPRPAAHSGQRNGGAERLGQREGPPYVVIVVCERDEMERRWADTAEERDRLVLELEQKFRDCLINVVPEG